MEDEPESPASRSPRCDCGPELEGRRRRPRRASARQQVQRRTEIASGVVMQTRRLGPFTVNAIGLGCMSMSHAYGTPDPVEAERTLNAALDIGYNFLDTAALYGFGKNEELVGRVMKQRRKDYVLASK